MRYQFFIFFFLLVSAQVHAKYSKTCSVKYKTEQGWSKTDTVNVTFLTGSKLNEATSTYNYTTYSVYGVTFWAKGDASVIKISSYLGCGIEADENCITSNGQDK